jgi:hypothetical protein
MELKFRCTARAQSASGLSLGVDLCRRRSRFPLRTERARYLNMLRVGPLPIQLA